MPSLENMHLQSSSVMVTVTIEVPTSKPGANDVTMSWIKNISSLFSSRTSLIMGTCIFLRCSRGANVKFPIDSI